MQRLWLLRKKKGLTTVHFYHARMLVYSWTSGSVTTNMYQFNEHTLWMATTSGSDKRVYPLLSLILMLLSVRGLARCCLSHTSLFIAFAVAQISDVLRWTFRRQA